MSLALTAIWPVSRRDSHNRRQFIAKVQFGPARRLVPAVLYLFHHKFQSSPQFLINYWPQCRDNRGEISYSKVLHFIWIGYNSNQWVFQCLVRLHLILWCPPTMASLRIHGKKFKILHTNVFMQILMIAKLLATLPLIPIQLNNTLWQRVFSSIPPPPPYKGGCGLTEVGGIVEVVTKRIVRSRGWIVESGNRKRHWISLFPLSDRLWPLCRPFESCWLNIGSNNNTHM